MSSILKALKKLEQNADTTVGMRAEIIVQSTDRPRIRSVMMQSLIIVTTLVIFAAVGFIISRKPAISPQQSPAPAAGISQKTISPSNEPLKRADIIEKQKTTTLDAKTVKRDDAHTGLERPAVSCTKSKASSFEPIFSDVPASTEIKEINDNASLTLQAISWSTHANKRIVIINSQICREGEHVDGYVVKQINPSDVVVSNGSTSGKLSFKIR